jgi:hypothetical protein
LSLEPAGVDLWFHHQSVDPEVAVSTEEICQETCYILRCTKTWKNNISKAEHDIVLTLLEDKDIIMLPADRGNSTVIMATMDYYNKCLLS